MTYSYKEKELISASLLILFKWVGNWSKWSAIMEAWTEEVGGILGATGWRQGRVG